MKLAIITGGSRGIGAELVAQYKQEGFTAKEFSRRGKSKDSIVVDLSKPAEVQEIIEPLFNDWAGQDLEEIVFFNNASTPMPLGVLANKPVDEILTNINLNYTSAVLLMRAFVGAFQKTACPKTVANITSGLAVGNIFGASLYSGAKAGIEHFVRGLSTEQVNQPYPIRYLNINPGPTDTAMHAAVRGQSPEDLPSVDMFIRDMEAGKIKSPATVASAIRHLVAARPESGSRHNI